MPNIKSKKQDEKLPIVWVVGGSGKLGIALSEHLNKKYAIVSLTRNLKEKKLGRVSYISIDLSNLSQVSSVINKTLDHGYPRAVVFCQRFRPSVESDRLDVISGMNVEITSTQLIIERLVNRDKKMSCSVVIISSVNGQLVNKKLPFCYHWLKASQIALVKYYSVNNGKFATNINCIASGSFLKDEISAYPTKLKRYFASLKVSCPMKNITHVQDIVQLAEFLISDRSGMVNGQIITLDGGMTNILQEALI